jgi:hypothetical protein
MSTISMQTGFAGSGSASLPGGSQAYSLTNGVAAVNPVDVPLALRAGWKLNGGADVAYAAAAVRVMTPPASSVITNGTVTTFPDGNTATLTAAVLIVPSQYVAWMQEQKWVLVG